MSMRIILVMVGVCMVELNYIITLINFIKSFLKSKGYKPARIKIVEENIFKINYEVKSEHRNFLIAER